MNRKRLCRLYQKDSVSLRLKRLLGMSALLGWSLDYAKRMMRLIKPLRCRRTATACPPALVYDRESGGTRWVLPPQGELGHWG